jgi:hypothetical protein
MLSDGRVFSWIGGSVIGALMTILIVAQILLPSNLYGTYDVWTTTATAGIRYGINRRGELLVNFTSFDSVSRYAHLTKSFDTYVSVLSSEASKNPAT